MRFWRSAQKSKHGIGHFDFKKRSIKVHLDTSLFRVIFRVISIQKYFVLFQNIISNQYKMFSKKLLYIGKKQYIHDI